MDIDTADSVNICCFSMRQKSRSRAIRRFLGMMSAFHKGSKVSSNHVDNESADALERLSMVCNCAYDYDTAKMAASLSHTLDQQLTKLACRRLPVKPQPFSRKRKLKGKVLCAFSIATPDVCQFVPTKEDAAEFLTELRSEHIRLLGKVSHRWNSVGKDCSMEFSHRWCCSCVLLICPWVKHLRWLKAMIR